MSWYTSDAGLQTMGGQVVSSSLLTTVTSGASPNTVGNWVAMFTATAFPVSAFRLHLGKTGIASAGINRQALLNIGIGASGSERVIVPNIAFGGSLAFVSWWLPLAIPVGTRVSVQFQCLTASVATTMGMQLWGGGFGVEGGTVATTYGATPASSIGTALALPASINTAEGAWTQLSASTTTPMRWMLVGMSAPNNALVTAADHFIDIGVGVAGVESTILTDLVYSCSVNEEVNAPYPLSFPVNLPTGVRLIARYRGTAITNASQPNITVTGIC